MTTTSSHAPPPITFLPAPFEDETLQSLLARQARMLAAEADQPFIEAAFGAGAATVRALLPGRLAYFANAAGGRCSASLEHAIDRWTAAAYFVPFMSARAAAALRHDLLCGHRTGGGGVCSDLRHERLNFCPQCVEEDVAARGIAGWRRVHQLPGVYACPRHGAALLASEATSAASAKLVACPGPGPGRPLRPAFAAALAGRIASGSAWLLANPHPPLLAASVQSAFRELLRERGLLTASGAAVGGLPQLILSAAFGQLSAVPPGMLARRSVQRLWGRAATLGGGALGALLTLDYLGVGPGHLFARCAAMPGEPRPRRAMPSVRPRTIVRHRAAIRAAAAAPARPSRAEIRRAFPTAYCFLLQHDRGWLEDELPPVRKGSRCADWAARDRLLATRAMAVCGRLGQAPGRPVRLTFSAIATAMGLRTVLYRRDDRLARTLAVIDAAVEDDAALMKRRLRWAAVPGSGPLPSSFDAFAVRAGIRRGLAIPAFAAEARAVFGQTADTAR